MTTPAQNQEYSREEYLGLTFTNELGRTISVATKEIHVGRGILGTVPEVATRLLPAGTWALVCDDNTYKAAGATVEAALKAAGKAVKLVRLSGKPKADIPSVENVKDRVKDCQGLISVGSGTINDLSKASTTLLDMPYVTVATAASMNGYCSSVAALFDSGLKVTRPATPAIGVVADLEVLVKAPLELTRAGLGDVVSKPVCNADWKLSQLLLETYFSIRPFELIRELEDVYLPGAAGLASGEPEAIAALTEALAYSGISMVIAGSSAPASGGEHLISHTIDMRSYIEDFEHDYHGTQVGVATCFMIRLYKLLLSRENPGFVEFGAVDLDELKAQLKSHWKGSTDAVMPQALAQFDEAGTPNVTAKTIKERWSEIAAELKPFLHGAERIEPALKAAGSAYHYSDLGMSKDEFCEHVRRAPFIRNRYTLLHLLRDTGLLEGMMAEVINGWHK